MSIPTYELDFLEKEYCRLLAQVKKLAVENLQLKDEIEKLKGM